MIGRKDAKGYVFNFLWSRMLEKIGSLSGRAQRSVGEEARKNLHFVCSQTRICASRPYQCFRFKGHLKNDETRDNVFSEAWYIYQTGITQSIHRWSEK